MKHGGKSTAFLYVDLGCESQRAHQHLPQCTVPAGTALRRWTPENSREIPEPTKWAA